MSAFACPHGYQVDPASPFDPRSCRTCWVQAGGAVVRAAAGKCGRVARRPLPVLPCPLLGDQLTGEQREALSLDHRRTWTWCNHPLKPLGEAVCTCKGCGPRCPGYPAD